MSSTGGWYPDPHVPGRVRWWDGKWTDHVQDDPRLAPRPEELVATPAVAPVAAPVAAAMAPAPAPAPAAPIAPAPAPPAPASSGDGAPPPPPFPTEPAPPDLLEPGVRKGASLRMLLFAVGLVAVALALMLVVSGVVQLGGSSGEDPTFEVYEGPAYTVEVPRVWEQLETPASANIDASFRTSQGGVFTIGSAQGDADELADPAARSAAVDLIVQVQLAVYPQVQVAGREPMTLDGAPAERVTLEGVTPQGQPIRVTQVIAVQDGLLVFLGIEGAPEALSADSIALEHATTTFELT